MKFFNKLWKILLWVGGLFGVSFLLGLRKSKEVKELQGLIKKSKKAEKGVSEKIEKLGESKKSNKKEIKKLEKDLTSIKKSIKKMEVTYEEDDVEDAVKFLRKFSKDN